MSTPMIEMLLRRRSVKPAEMVGDAPGPDAGQLQMILTAAARVPDHKKLVPWQFIVVEGEGRQRLGTVLADALIAEDKERPSDFRLDSERKRPLDAPLIVAVVSRATPGVPGAPEWEQILSAGAACFNLCLAANALGFATNWLTGWYAYSPHVQKAMGLSDGERFAGFIYVGQAATVPEDRERPDLAQVVSRF